MVAYYLNGYILNLGHSNHTGVFFPRRRHVAPRIASLLGMSRLVCLSVRRIAHGIFFEPRYRLYSNSTLL